MDDSFEIAWWLLKNEVTCDRKGLLKLYAKMPRPYSPHHEIYNYIRSSNTLI